MFFQKVTKFDEIFTFDVKSTVKISSIFVAFLENMTFTTIRVQFQKGFGPVLRTTTGEEGGGKLAILRLLSISANSRLDYSAGLAVAVVLAKIKF